MNHGSVVKASGGSMTRAARVLSSLASLALLIGCGTESDRSIAGTLVADHTSNLSAWSEPVPLGPPINMLGFNDQQATLSKDGLDLYFASARPEAPGDVNPDLNLWVAHRACANDSCPWESPVSLGSTVNGSVNDFAPALSRDEHWLFFASPRQPDGFGSSDIWASYRDDVHDDLAWQEPINLGARINTAADERHPLIYSHGETEMLFFARNVATPPAVDLDLFVSTRTRVGNVP